MAKAAANALYDPHYGWNPPARFQQERAWCEVVQKEKKIQAVHEQENRERDRRGSQRGHKWPGGPACGRGGVAETAPFFADGDIWRGELLKRQPLKAHPESSQRNSHRTKELARMDTMAIVGEN